MLSRQTKIEINCLLTNDYEYVLINSDISQSNAMFVIDLTAGVASGLSCARQLASQLKLTIPDRIMTSGSAEAITPLNSIASWVDSEGRGDIVLQKSYHLANQIAAEFANTTNATLLLLLGHTNLEEIPSEECFFLWFLFNHPKIQQQTFIQTAGKAQLNAVLSWLIPRWTKVQDVAYATQSNVGIENLLITLIPGLIPGELLDRLLKAGHGLTIQFLALNGGDYLINPTQRSLAKPGAIRTLPEFNQILRAFPKLYASLILCGYSPEDRDISMLTNIAWAITGQGGISLAQKVVEALLAHCHERSLTEYFAVLMELQKLRISAQHYFPAAQDIVDYQLIPGDGIRDYKITLGWARVLSGDSLGAYEVFSSIDAPSVTELKSPIDLYLCNIYALVLFRAGKTDDALAIELAINRHLTELEEPNYHLSYINNFNLARLYRFLGDLDREQAYFNKVLETTNGLRTESDQIYFNLTQAAIYERRGQPLEALVSTWLACVHWLACEVPEAIGWRTLLTLYSKRQVIQPDLLPDISNKLAETLSARLNSASLVLPEIDFQPPNFIKISAFSNPIKKLNQAKIYCHQQYGVLLGLPQPTQSSLNSAEHHCLSALVTAIFQLDSQFSLAEVSTLVVDDCYGHEILDSTYGELIASIRWGINDEQANFHSMLNRVSVTFGQGISSVELKNNALVKVTFKRYLSPFDIPEMMQAALAKLYKQGICTLAEFVTELNLTKEDEIRCVINMLESERVCQLVASK